MRDLRGRVVGLAIPPPFGHANPECLDSSHRVIINMRVLLIAPHCAPFGSEPSMGYNLTKAIADHAEVSVATHCFFKDAIDKAGGLGKAEPVYLDLEAQAARALAISQRFKFAAAGSTLVSYPLMVAFERELWRQMKQDLQAGRFDIVHRITPQSSALPSAMASLSPVPFMIGPINGSLSVSEALSRPPLEGA